MKTRKNLIVKGGLIAGILILLNIIALSHFFRLDFTADQRYTLSSSTETLMAELNEPITVTAYFSADLPAYYARIKRDFKDMLIEYGNLSKGNLVYEFVDPSETPELEQQAIQAGVQPLLLDVREKNKVKQQKAFMGAVIRMGERSESLPFIQPDGAMEYELSTSIKKLSIIDKPLVALLQGHGEPPIGELPQVKQQLDVLYDVVGLQLTDTSIIDQNTKTVVVLAPTDTIPVAHIRQLDQFMMQGGNVLVALNRNRPDLQQSAIYGLSTGIEPWLREKGINVLENVVLDANCGNISVRPQGSFFTFNVPFPFLPSILKFEEHPITAGLENVMLEFASSVEFSGDTSIQSFIPIVTTSEQGAVQSLPTVFNFEKQWQDGDFPLANVPIGAAVVSKTNPEMGKLIVIADGDFVINGSGQQMTEKQPDNISLFVNSIDWMSDETGLIDLRTKAVTFRPLDQLEESTTEYIKWLNFLLPVLLVIIYGVFRAQKKKRLRKLRMVGNHG